MEKILSETSAAVLHCIPKTFKMSFPSQSFPPQTRVDMDIFMT